jgi:pimeloyl-ACP methyl ester carboxylesterase
MSSFFNFKSTKIHYSVKGEGNAIVLLHGFLESMEIWKKFSEELSKTNKVICIDLPGHGKSENISQVHSMQLIADIVYEILMQLVINKATIIGHSMGGYVGLAFAKKYPNQCKSLCLFHSHASEDTPQAKINRARAAKIVSDNHQGFIASFIPDLFSKENQIKYADEINIRKNKAKQTSKEGIIAALYGMREREDMIGFLAQTKIPILFIVGKKDSRIPLEMMKNQVFIPQNSSALILDEVAHMGYIESEIKCLKAISAFVNY